MYRPRRHLSQMHTTNYRPMSFIRENAAFWQNCGPIEGRVPHPPPLNLPLHMQALYKCCIIKAYIYILHCILKNHAN